MFIFPQHCSGHKFAWHGGDSGGGGGGVGVQDIEGGGGRVPVQDVEGRLGVDVQEGKGGECGVV